MEPSAPKSGVASIGRIVNGQVKQGLAVEDKPVLAAVTLEITECSTSTGLPKGDFLRDEKSAINDSAPYFFGAYKTT